MVGAVIFDFDGVITDSEILHLRSFNQVLSQFGLKVEKDEYYKKYLGFNDFDLFGHFVESGKLKPADKTVEKLVEEKSQIFEQLASTEGQTIEGVYEFLQLLAQNNIPMAIYSGALRSEIELVLDKADLRSFFEVIVSAEQVKKGKPNPEGFILALQKLNELHQPAISAKDCVVIEDSHWGLVAAIAAGMHTVAVTNSYRAEELGLAERTVESLSELTIDQLNDLCR